MTITGSMWTGLSGLFASGNSIGVTSDNIANINTVGYRASRTQFADILGRSMGSVGQMGAGVRLAKIEKLFSQGAIVQSARSTDMAISGRGMFMVKGDHNGVGGTYLTRAGQFSLNQDGYLVNPNGLVVQGFTADERGNIGSGIGDVKVNAPTVPPRATSSINLNMNLDGSPGVEVLTFDPADPNGSSNFSATVNVYDSLGAAHNVTVYFNKTATGWDWRAMADGAEVVGGAAGTPTEIASGSMTFTTEGILDTETINANTVDWLGATPGQVLDFDFGDSITTDGGTGLSGTTSYASAFSLNGTQQDGYAVGEFVDIDVAADGTVTGLYNNGQRRTFARLAIADFRNPSGLERVGGTLFRATSESGEAQVGFAGVGGRGEVFGSSLEQSNVDLSTEFVRLINDQRAYQAASRTITTADELLAETVNLKR